MAGTDLTHVVLGGGQRQTQPPPPRGRVLSAPEDLLVFEYDGTIERGQPQVVVFPDTTAEVAAAVVIANRYDLPIVPRGAGTGLSGGAVAAVGGVIVALTRMRRLLEVDVAHRTALGAPGGVHPPPRHLRPHRPGAGRRPRRHRRRAGARRPRDDGRRHAASAGRPQHGLPARGGGCAAARGRGPSRSRRGGRRSGPRRLPGGRRPRDPRGPPPRPPPAAPGGAPGGGGRVRAAP